MASVSRTALQQVKSAMTTFASESERALSNLCQQASSSTNQCAQSLETVMRQRDSLAAVVAKQKQQVQSLRQQQETLTVEIKTLETSFPQLERKLEELIRRIASLNKHLSELRKRLSETNDEESKEQIQKNIDDAERERQQCISQKDKTEQQLSETRRNIAEKRSRLSQIKSDLAELETQLQANEHQLLFFTDKCERLKNAFVSVKDSVESLVNSAKRLQGGQTIANSASCIDACIASLDEYLGVSF